MINITKIIIWTFVVIILTLQTTFSNYRDSFDNINKTHLGMISDLCKMIDKCIDSNFMCWINGLRDVFFAYLKSLKNNLVKLNNTVNVYKYLYNTLLTNNFKKTSDKLNILLNPVLILNYFRHVNERLNILLNWISKFSNGTLHHWVNKFDLLIILPFILAPVTFTLLILTCIAKTLDIFLIRYLNIPKLATYYLWGTVVGRVVLFLIE